MVQLEITQLVLSQGERSPEVTGVMARGEGQGCCTGGASAFGSKQGKLSSSCLLLPFFLVVVFQR